MDLVEFVGVIRKWIWLVLIVVVVVTGYTVYSNARSKSSYSSETTVVAGLSQIASTSALGLNIAVSGDRISATYAELITADPVMEKALDKAGLDWPASTLAGMTSSTTTKNTPVLRIAVTDSDPNRAQLLANAVSDSFVEYVSDIGASGAKDAQQVTISELNDVDRQLAELNASAQPEAGAVKALQDRHDALVKEYQGLLDQQAHANDIRVVDPASSAFQVGAPASQRLAIGFVISLVAGIVVAFLAEAVQKSLRAPREGKA